MVVTKPTALKYKSKNFESNAFENSQLEDHKSNGSKGESVKAKILKNSPQHQAAPLKIKTEKKTKIKLKVHKEESDNLDESSGNLSILSKSLKKTGKKKKNHDDEEEGKLYTINTGMYLANKGSNPVERVGTAPLKLCYICCREFGSRSLGIHEPQCLEVSSKNL